ncbi:hypothetical protein SERLA73DRAFT_164838 [Serpula lacrymans var. lacrymans S7.3]|uniref:Uncharacterized protein n=2 Tax=Serpula lacrymans var. lacrymans TaxID=341189 RepID=F8PFJ4_SERL3|nr:uncharacterized protein SERLADRAFT_444715 [Serpula lacrymans var. lacrymans S7.9]EGO05283.1 hypothetical protein SERLA73DRAFT_164838 [Serpula lacrymans var. lacrymans S7.3]EGO31140.1 hypothetical protein SERLADRAFT_444715 [Serpula lacrymans var. lacrymans S7.9]
MAATASSRANRDPPPSGRQSHFASPPPNISIAKGATARSALTNSRVSANVSSAAARRPSIKGATQSHPEGREPHTHRDDTEERDRLLLQIQQKDQTISTLTQTNNSLSSALNEADSRLNDFYADQSRMEEEMSARIEIADKLRAQVRELEKEKRDVQRRYNEQTSTFDAERQAFYDNEQHLKSRIQSLSQVRRQPVVVRPPESDTGHDSDDSEITESSLTHTEHESDDSETTESSLTHTSYLSGYTTNYEESEPAEMTALRLELSTLSTSYASLQSTLILLQTQLVDLKRVNNELQEENESYMILLREKTLSGQFDLLRQVGTTSTTEGDDDDLYDTTSGGSGGSLKSSGRSTLDRVDEMSEHEHDLESDEEDQLDLEESEATRHTGRHSHKRSSGLSSPGGRAPRGESLAGLPITGPGLDLAAELGRAENKDIIGGTSIEDSGAFPYGKGKRGKKGSSESRKVSATSEGLETGAPASDLDALRSEVKSLKDANKALSLYASKIIDRIIAEEGFEHVLSIDYEKSPITPSATGPRSPFPPSIDTAKARRHSAFFPRSTSTFGQTGESSPNPLSPSQPASSSTKAQRRSLSFDWKNFSMFGGGDKKNESANLRPLTLKPGASSVTGARKLETYEDEDDRRERERLNATMKLMGLEKPTETPVIIRSGLSSPAPPMQKSYSSPASPPAVPSRFSFFRSQTSHSETSSIHSAHSAPNSHLAPYGLGIDGNERSELTQEALEHVEAQNALVALDTHEKVLSEEIAKGARSGFTELSPRSLNGEDRRSRRSKRSGNGSGSTVWSAGMSRSGDEPEVV